MPIYQTAACPLDEAVRRQVPVVLSVFNRDVDVVLLADTLKAAGFARIVSFLELHASFASELGDRFWLTGRDQISMGEDIAKADRLWADDTSVALYRGNIALRQRGAYEGPVNRPKQSSQYMPIDVPGWLQGEPLRFVDCGAYRGDTLEQLIDANKTVEASALFEPDADNFAVLARVSRERRQAIRDSLLLWPCAVTAKSGSVSFASGLDEASSIRSDAETTVAAVALDDVLVGWRPSFIKMDIEGAEVDALNGARRTIAEYRPDLAICVYHRPDHLWAIPLLLASWPEMRGYGFYLRSHGFNGFDTVLYVTPK